MCSTITQREIKHSQEQVPESTGANGEAVDMMPGLSESLIQTTYVATLRY